jgi:IstB-like ATP binding protein
VSSLDFGTHAELEQRQEYTDPTGCGGRMLVVEQGSIVWEIACDECGFSAGVPTRLISPEEHNAGLLGRRRDLSGIPLALRGLPLPEDVSAAASAICAWARGDGRAGLTLAGQVGVGKTHAAAAAAWERVRLGPLRWFSVPVLFAQLGRSFSDEGRHDALGVLVGTEALVLDDLDKTRPSEYAAEQLFCAIDARVTADAALLITTNLALSELAERFPEPYGEAIVSRIVGYCDTFEMRGADRRLERFAT